MTSPACPIREFKDLVFFYGWIIVALSTGAGKTCTMSDHS